MQRFCAEELGKCSEEAACIDLAFDQIKRYPHLDALAEHYIELGDVAAAMYNLLLTIVHQARARICIRLEMKTRLMPAKSRLLRCRW